MSYSVKFSKAGKQHLIFVNSLLERPDIPHTAKEEFEWGVALLRIHKQTCKECTKAAIKAVKQGFKDLATSKSSPVSDI